MLPGLTLEVRVELPLLALLAHGVVFRPLQFTLFGILASTFSNLTWSKEPREIRGSWLSGPVVESGHSDLPWCLTDSAAGPRRSNRVGSAAGTLPFGKTGLVPRRMRPNPELLCLEVRKGQPKETPKVIRGSQVELAVAEGLPIEALECHDSRSSHRRRSMVACGFSTNYHHRR